MMKTIRVILNGKGTANPQVREAINRTHEEMKTVSPPKDGTYWMPVTDGYYFILRYYGPTSRLNGNPVHDLLFKGTKPGPKFTATEF